MTDTTLLLRQIHPTFIQAGRVTSQAFRPTIKDEGLLSVYDGDLISAHNAWLHHTTVNECKSQGVLAITVVECAAESLGTRSDTDTFAEHAVVDFCGLSSNEMERKGKKLKVKATDRGWQFQC